MRALVVEEDHLVRWVRRRAVDFLARRLRRKVAVLGEQLPGDRACDPLEVLARRKTEIAEQDRAVLVEPGVDLVAVRAAQSARSTPSVLGVTTCGNSLPSIRFVSTSSATSTALRRIVPSPEGLGPSCSERDSLTVVSFSLSIDRALRARRGRRALGQRAPPRCPGRVRDIVERPFRGFLRRPRRAKDRRTHTGAKVTSKSCSGRLRPSPRALMNASFRVQQRRNASGRAPRPWARSVATSVGEKKRSAMSSSSRRA